MEQPSAASTSCETGSCVRVVFSDSVEHTAVIRLSEDRPNWSAHCIAVPLDSFIKFVHDVKAGVYDQNIEHYVGGKIS